MTFRPDPKPESQKLSPKEYHELRLKIHAKQFFCCLGCGFYSAFDQFTLHHKKTKGAHGRIDTEENCDGYHTWCHPD